MQAQNTPDLDPEPLFPSIPVCMGSFYSICIQKLPPSIPTSSTGQRQVFLKPSLPLDFDSDWALGKAFLTFYQIYIHLCPEAFDDNLIKIIWTMFYMKS